MTILQDWPENRGNLKGRIVLILFRLASACAKMPSWLRWIGLPYVALYRCLVEWGLCIELPWKLRVGPGLRVFHGHALVVNDRAVIGRRCVLRNSTTIGVSTTSRTYDGQAPVIGDDVDIGANVVIVGNVQVGDRALIGAGSVVVADVPADAVVVGNPARVLRIKGAQV